MAALVLSVECFMFSDHVFTSAVRNRKVKRSGLRRQLFGLQQLDQRMLLAGDLAIDSNCLLYTSPSPRD